MIRLVKPSRGHITQIYSNRQPDGNPHAGQDYAYSNGTEIFPEVYAAADGVVLFAGDSRGLSWPNIMYLNPDFDRSDNVDSSAGNYTIIAHYVNGVQVALTGYGHQEEVWVKAGDTVRAGQRIGTVGETGFSAGKHLHFDLVIAPFRVNVAPYYGRVDPNPYFTSGITPQGTTTPLSEEDFMGGTIDAQQADDIARAAAGYVFELLDNKLRINAVQAESIVQATTERTAVAVDANASGKQIDKQQADDIARAAAQYNQERDAGLYAKES